VNLGGNLKGPISTPSKFITPIVQNFQSQYASLSDSWSLMRPKPNDREPRGVDKLMGQQMAEFDAFGIKESYVATD